MTVPRLLPLSKAAAMLGLPEKSLLREAEKHGHLVRVGRAVRILESELGELIRKCRSKPKGPASHCESGQGETPSGLSRTPVNPNVAHAREIAAKLKSSSRNTSARKPAEVVQLGRQK